MSNRRLFDSIKLIQLIKDRKAFYDGNHKLHRNKEYMHMLWSEIADELNSTVGEVRCKWQNLRSNYCREKRRIGITNGTSSWPYYDLMSFVDEYSKSHTSKKSWMKTDDVDRLSSDDYVTIVDDDDDLEIISDDSQKAVISNNFKMGLLASSNDSDLPVIKSARSLLGKRPWEEESEGSILPVKVPFTQRLDNLPEKVHSASSKKKIRSNKSKSSRIKINTALKKRPKSVTISTKPPENRTTLSSATPALFYDEIDSEGSDDDASPGLQIDESRISSDSEEITIPVKSNEPILKKIENQSLEKVKINETLLSPIHFKPITLKLQNQKDSMDSKSDLSIPNSPKNTSPAREAQDFNYESMSDRRSIDLDVDNEPDMLFLRSLLPSIRELTPIHNLEFKEEVIQLLKRKLLQSSHVGNNS